MDRPLRLIAANPVEELARTIEALLVVASVPLAARGACRGDARRRPSASAMRSSCSRERYSEGRSGIVLEHVAGGYAFRASREAAEACARLFERPVERGLTQAALETLAIVAYLGPCTRPGDRPHPRASTPTPRSPACVERGLLAEAGRDESSARCATARRPLRARLRARVARRAAAARRHRGDAPELRERLEAVADRAAPERLHRRPAARERPWQRCLSRDGGDRARRHSSGGDRAVRQRAGAGRLLGRAGASPACSSAPVLEAAVRGSAGSCSRRSTSMPTRSSRRASSVSGIPAVKAFRNGEVVAEFVGARPPRGRRASSTSYPATGRRNDRRPRAAAALGRGDYERALERCSLVPRTPRGATRRAG